MTILHLLITVALAAATPAIGERASTEVIVQKVQDRFDATQDFTGSLHQELVIASVGRTVSADGTVAFKRPGKMRWTLQGDDPQVIVADGTTLWFYQPEEQQVLKAPFRAAFRSTTPISFLTGVGRISDDFTASVEEQGEGLLQLGLVPRKGEGDLGRLRLTVETANYDIVGAEIHDPLGNVTHLRFSDLKRNQGLADSLFEFTVPPGVDVVEAPIGD